MIVRTFYVSDLEDALPRAIIDAESPRAAAREYARRYAFTAEELADDGRFIVGEVVTLDATDID